MNGALHRVVVERRSPVRALAVLAAVVLGSPGALAGPADRKPPTAPQNLRVTASAHYSVSLAWDASTDNSGFLTYWIQGPRHGQAHHGPPGALAKRIRRMP